MLLRRGETKELRDGCSRRPVESAKVCGHKEIAMNNLSFNVTNNLKSTRHEMICSNESIQSNIEGIEAYYLKAGRGL